MKSVDPRHEKRQKTVQELFSLSFQDQQVSDDVKKIQDNLDAIDTIIKDIAPEYPIDKINKVDLAILRLAIFEMKIEKSAPEKVIINESVELAKEFGGDTSPAFINGALGKLI